MQKTNLCLYFQVHQPFRIQKDFDFFAISDLTREFEDHELNEKVLRKVADNCYLPTNKLLLQLIEKHQGAFKVAFSISGVILEQFELYAPEVITSFQELAKTGQVEFLTETYYHSLAFVKSKSEFREQVKEHDQKIQDLFGQKPVTFRNTELIYNNDLAVEIQKMGYQVILSEGVDRILQEKSCNDYYSPISAPSIKLLLKNYTLSDDIAFRYNDKKWGKGGLTSKKFVNNLLKLPATARHVGIFVDYETFGEHQHAQSGIFTFLEKLPDDILKSDRFAFITPKESISQPSTGLIDCEEFTSWADESRDLSAWLGNPMQQSAVNMAYTLEKEVKETNSPTLIRSWKRLLTSDHAYYASTKGWGDGAVHNYFSPYDDPHSAFIVYMNALHNLQSKVRTSLSNHQ